MKSQDGQRCVDRLAERLRRALFESGLTQREVARRSRSFNDASYLNRALSGKETLSLAALQSVAEVLSLDYQALLAEAGLDEETYRSRHAPDSARTAKPATRTVDVQTLLSDTLDEVRRQKAAGRPKEAQSAIDTTERIVTQHLGGFPRHRQAMLTWAALLCERVGIVQDTQMPGTVVAGAAPDLGTVAAIETEYQAPDLETVDHFYAGDVHFKDGDFAGALPHYAWAAVHAPAAGLRARSLAGQATALASRQQTGDRMAFWNASGEVGDLVSQGEPEPAPAYVWDSERWPLASLWSEATVARSLVLLGERRAAERALERLSRRYDGARATRFAHAPFAIALAHLRFLAACEGVFDASESDIQGLGREAYRLADDGGCVRTRREVEAMMAGRFGIQAWL